jgi:hypothetical protein
MTLSTIYQDLYQRNKGLTIMGNLYFILFACLLLAFFVDNRTLLGINLWIKPMKFALSIGIFSWTFAYLMSFLPYSDRRIKIFSNIFICTMLIEIVVIVGQAAIGQKSHFNMESALGSMLFSLMGVAIMTAFVVICSITWSYFRMKTALSSDMLLAIRSGLVILIFANIGGMLMSSLLRHSIGARDGGEGLPFVNWSTVAGDLRVMHFFGLHAIQFLPFVALFFTFFIKKEIPERKKIVGIAALLYGGFVLWTFLQAWMGMPFLAIG